MKAFTTDQFDLPLPPGHTFPREKYSRLRQRVLSEGLVRPEDMIVPPRAAEVDVLRVHDPDYYRRVSDGRLEPAEVRAIGLPWSAELVERSLRSCSATVAAAREALGRAVASGRRADGLPVAINLAGGTHHAFRDRGAGYCVFNDAAIAARAMQAEGRVRRVVILDCDVHQGDGTATIFSEDPTVFTFSIHGARNYPLRKQQGDLDIALDDGTGDDAYLEALERGLEIAIERSEADLAIYLAGADPYEDDRLGRLKLTFDGLARRDRMVLTACRDAGLPVALAMAGGYARQIEDTVRIQVETVRIAAELSRD